MDPEDLNHINQLLDHDVELREVLHAPSKLSSNLCLTVSQKIKDQVTELDKKTRTMVGLLNKIHSTPSKSSQFHQGCSKLL
jgi:hypothetical protein